MLATLGQIVGRIRDELLLWLLALLIIAVIAGLRDLVIFVTVLAVGAAIIGLRLFLTHLREGRSGVADQRNIPLALGFRGRDPVLVQLAECRYELRDNENKLKKEGELAFALEINSWVCYLPKETTPDDIIRLLLTDGDGGRWETGPFRPLFGTKEAEQVG